MLCIAYTTAVGEVQYAVCRELGYKLADDADRLALGQEWHIRGGIRANT